jgi:predicted transcriptional regulator
MPLIEEIMAGIQRKRVEREEAVKRILTDIQKKKMIEDYREERRK